MTDFHERVLAVVRAIPRGTVLPYGEVATLAGTPRAARAVGSVLRTRTEPGDEVPWQRVINAQGRISSRGDVVRATLQRDLLEAEGVEFDASDTIDLARFGWRPVDAPTFFDEPVPSFEPPDDWDE